MLADFLSWYLIVLNWLSTLIVGGLSIALFVSFRKKKTTGTLMLFTAYFVLFINRTLGSTQKTIQVAASIFNDFGKIITGLAMVIPVLTVVFLYAFACRGIFKDSEYLRTITIIVISIIIGLATAIIFMNLYFEIPEGMFSIQANNATDYIQSFSITFVSIMVLVVQIIIYLRITISSFILAKNSDEITRKRGFQFIAIGSLLFLIGGVMIGGMSALELGLGMTIFMETLRRFIFLASYYVLYVGWTLPDWFRRRLREKSWFEKQYTTPVE